VVIHQGHRVAEAIGYVHASVLAGCLRMGGGLSGRHVAVVPHPSGRNRYWNNPANRDAARVFLRIMMDRRP
jgi:uracil-DNA glycosylase